MQAKDDKIHCGYYGIDMAYAATGNNDAIAGLLHLALSDVRRAVVTNIGFVLCNNRKRLQKIAQLLQNSYNSYKQYGAAALEVASTRAGNGNATKILKTLLKDNVSHDQQAGLVLLGMLLMEPNCIIMSKLHLQQLKLCKCVEMIVNQIYDILFVDNAISVYFMMVHMF